MDFIRKSLRTAPAMLAMGAMLVFAGAPQAKADDDHRDCRERIERDQARLDRAVQRHGEGSRQARHARHELNEQREKCWNRYHGYWGQDQRWHDQRDWDDRDHDRH